MPPPPNKTKNKDGDLPLLDLFAVMAIEQNPPKGHEALCWVLLSILTKEEWTILYRKVHKTKYLPDYPSTVGEVFIWIAKLGGYIGRRTDPRPRMISLWRGSQRLMDMVEDCG